MARLDRISWKNWDFNQNDRWIWARDSAGRICGVLFWVVACLQWGKTKPAQSEWKGNVEKQRGWRRWVKCGSDSENGKLGLDISWSEIKWIRSLPMFLIWLWHRQLPLDYRFKIVCVWGGSFSIFPLLRRFWDQTQVIRQHRGLPHYAVLVSPLQIFSEHLLLN